MQLLQAGLSLLYRRFSGRHHRDHLLPGYRRSVDEPEQRGLRFGTVLGGAYEYICSVFTELVFGTVFWDYSHLPFNLGGRINLLFCFFWGIAAVVWLKLCYPRLSGLIERLPIRLGKRLTWIMIVFMVINILVSALALARYTQRHTMPDAPPTALSQLLDQRFPDERMEHIYPNAKLVD